jgi:hypothetical protein
MFALLFLASMGCSTTSVELAQDCDVRLEVLTPSEGESGTEVTAGITPASTVWDTAVYVGSQRAEVLAVQREDCLNCDECRADNDCSECEDCDACDEQCDIECVETVTFKAIGNEPGRVQVSIYNGYGQSNTQPFSLMASDTGGPVDEDTAADSGSTGIDSGDPGVPDTGESSPTDSGVD